MRFSYNIALTFSTSEPRIVTWINKDDNLVVSDYPVGKTVLEMGFVVRCCIPRVANKCSDFPSSLNHFSFDHCVFHAQWRLLRWGTWQPFGASPEGFNESADILSQPTSCLYLHLSTLVLSQLCRKIVHNRELLSNNVF